MMLRPIRVFAVFALAPMHFAAVDLDEERALRRSSENCDPTCPESQECKCQWWNSDDGLCDEWKCELAEETSIDALSAAAPAENCSPECSSSQTCKCSWWDSDDGSCEVYQCVPSGDTVDAEVFRHGDVDAFSSDPLHSRRAMSSKFTAEDLEEDAPRPLMAAPSLPDASSQPLPSDGTSMEPSGETKNGEDVACTAAVSSGDEVLDNEDVEAEESLAPGVSACCQCQDKSKVSYSKSGTCSLCKLGVRKKTRAPSGCIRGEADYKSTPEAECLAQCKTWAEKQ